MEESADDTRGLLVLHDEPESTRPAMLEARHSVEAVFVCASGGVLVLGWVDDVQRPLDSILLLSGGWRVTLHADALARRTRPDVAEAVRGPSAHAYGYMGFVFGDRAIRTDGPCEVRLVFRDGGHASATVAPRVVDDLQLRLVLISHIAQSPGPAGATAGAFSSLDRGLGDQIVGFNRAITRWIAAGPDVERFAGPPRAYRGSILVCLFGRPEFQFVQNALFSAVEGIENYEFIYVSNSPELADTLLDNARKMRRIHGLDQTLVLLPANAGFGAANNVAARSAGSDRLLFVNPDVFPKDRAWAQRHGELLASRPSEETRLFGAALYYDDGSLMHGGMYFERDTRLAFDRAGAHRSPRIRIEHYGKGAPADSPTFTRPRPVPAITGAFMSVERDWFERLGGFTEDYVFGHFEDADLCLKSLEAGTAPWLQDLRLWHLEGQGSPDDRVNDGAKLVNQWLFGRRWGGSLDPDLLGPDPDHPLLRSPAA